MWIRFPGLPIKYVSESLLKAIVERNKIGDVIRVAAFNPNGARLRYPRVCVCADLTKIPTKRILVPNERGELESYPVWFEDFPQGCGSCGSEEHKFEDCPGRRACNAGGNGVMGPGPEDFPSSDNSAEQSNDGGEWVQVARRVKPPPPTFGHSKEELWESFGKNVDLSSDSSSDESVSTVGEGTTTSFTESVVVEPLPPVPEIEEYDEVEEFQDHEEEAPVTVYPNDANQNAIEADFHDPEYYEADDEDMIDVDGDTEGGMVFSGIPADLTQEDFERLLGNIPTSTELDLQNFYSSENLPPSSLYALVAPPVSLVEQRVEQQGMEGSVKSESGKRKLGIEEGETACSKLMGGGSKRGKNEE